MITFFMMAGTVSCPVNSSRSACKYSANICFTSRSSSEWNVMTEHLPHEERRLIVSRRDISMDPNSSLTAIRIP